MKYTRQFSNTDPYQSVSWEERTAEILQGDTVVFRQENVRVPSSWSQLATNIAASKYFYGILNTPERETGVDKLVARIADTIADWGLQDNYFDSRVDSDAFRDDLIWLLLHQFAAFNSPVWFNLGLYQKYGVKADPCNWYWDKRTNRIKQPSNPFEYPQIAACFLQDVEDNMDSIMDLARSDAMLFKFGSGSGTNLSPLRASCEGISGGGKSSGPLSFMRIYDQVAEVVTSAGRNRRAALLSCLDIDHPDIKQFISCKAEEEAHARMLIDRGVSPERAARSVMYQNMNISVRVSDEFMQAVEADKEWVTHWITKPEQEGPKYRARDLWRKIAESTWLCGDPGIQYDTTINKWNTIPNVGRIKNSNPCSEFMSPGNAACNLASINLLKFYSLETGFDYETFQKVVRLLIIAQDILIDRASYPLKDIARNAHRCRQLGLGYTNFGALCMSMGLPYDSDEARTLCSNITSTLTARAYLTSVELADEVGQFEDYNNAAMMAVLNQHADAAGELNLSSQTLWEEVIEKGMAHGFRNSQVSLLQPSGTISFLMNCDTTGIEPELALVKTKTLVGGGTLQLVNSSFENGLKKLDWGEIDISQIKDYLLEHHSLQGYPGLETSLNVFATALGDNAISWLGHCKMMAAAQPFLSGAISKTINMPATATIEDIEEAYLTCWKLGLKSVAIYRDGSKGAQPLNIRKETVQPIVDHSNCRVRLPDTRQSLTHKFTIGGHSGYFTVGLYQNGQPGELFISVAKEGSTLGGIFDCFGIAVSIGLQYGVPLNEFIDKFSHVRFEPMGYTKNPELRTANSIIDYIFRWLELQFSERNISTPEGPIGTPVAVISPLDAPICDNCGQLCVRVGTCYLCYGCGTSGGCS